MVHTPLTDFFNQRQIEILMKRFAILSMEHLLALRKSSTDTRRVSIAIGCNIEKFLCIMDRAEEIINSKNKQYSLEQIKKAFWETFHKGGEFWFPYLWIEEVSEESTDDIWDSFTENLTRD